MKSERLDGVTYRWAMTVAMAVAAASLASTLYLVAVLKQEQEIQGDLLRWQQNLTAKLREDQHWSQQEIEVLWAQVIRARKEMTDLQAKLAPIVSTGTFVMTYTDGTTFNMLGVPAYPTPGVPSYTKLLSGELVKVPNPPASKFLCGSPVYR